MPTPVPVDDVLTQLSARLGQAEEGPQPGRYGRLAPLAAAWAGRRVPMLLAEKGYGAGAADLWAGYDDYALRLAVAQCSLMAAAGDAAARSDARAEVKDIEAELREMDPLILLDAAGAVIEPTTPPFAGGFSTGCLPDFADDRARADLW